MLPETLKLLLVEIEHNIDEYINDSNFDITNLHVHLSDGLPCISTKMVKTHEWRLIEVKEIIKTIMKELETKA